MQMQQLYCSLSTPLAATAKPTQLLACPTFAASQCTASSALPHNRSYGASAGAELAADLSAVETAVHNALAAALEVRWPVSRWPIYVFTGGQRVHIGCGEDACPAVASHSMPCCAWAAAYVAVAGLIQLAGAHCCIPPDYALCLSHSLHTQPAPWCAC